MRQAAVVFGGLDSDLSRTAAGAGLDARRTSGNQPVALLQLASGWVVDAKFRGTSLLLSLPAALAGQGAPGRGRAGRHRSRTVLLRQDAGSHFWRSLGRLHYDAAIRLRSASLGLCRHPGDFRMHSPSENFPGLRMALSISTLPSIYASHLRRRSLL